MLLNHPMLTKALRDAINQLYLGCLDPKLPITLDDIERTYIRITNAKHFPDEIREQIQIYLSSEELPLEPVHPKMNAGWTFVPERFSEAIRNRRAAEGFPPRKRKLRPGGIVG